MGAAFVAGGQFYCVSIIAWFSGGQVDRVHIIMGGGGHVGLQGGVARPGQQRQEPGRGAVHDGLARRDTARASVTKHNANLVNRRRFADSCARCYLKDRLRTCTAFARGMAHTAC